MSDEIRCTHDRAEQDTSLAADGMCPICANAEIARLRNELLDALDLKEGRGPTALSMVASERDRLRAELEEKEREVAEWESIESDRVKCAECGHTTAFKHHDGCQRRTGGKLKMDLDAALALLEEKERQAKRWDDALDRAVSQVSSLQDLLRTIRRRVANPKKAKWAREQIAFGIITEIDAALSGQAEHREQGAEERESTRVGGGGTATETASAPDSPVCSDEVRAWIQADLEEWEMHKREDKPEKVGRAAAAFTSGVVAGLNVALKRFDGPKRETKHGGDFTDRPITTDREEG